MMYPGESSFLSTANQKWEELDSDPLDSPSHQSSAMMSCNNLDADPKSEEKTEKTKKSKKDKKNSEAVTVISNPDSLFDIPPPRQELEFVSPRGQNNPQSGAEEPVTTTVITSTAKITTSDVAENPKRTDTGRTLGSPAIPDVGNETISMIRGYAFSTQALRDSVYTSASSSTSLSQVESQYIDKAFQEINLDNELLDSQLNYLRNSDIWPFLMSDPFLEEFGSKEMAATAHRIVIVNGIEYKSVLINLPEVEWIRRDLPLALFKFLHKQTIRNKNSIVTTLNLQDNLKRNASSSGPVEFTPCMNPSGITDKKNKNDDFEALVTERAENPEACNEVVTLLWVHGLQLNLSQDEIRQAIQIIVQDNWLDSIESLRSVPDSTWGEFPINPAFIDSVKQALNPSAQSAAPHPASALKQSLRSIASRIGRPESATDEIAERLCAEYGIRCLDDMAALPSDRWPRLQLPVRLQEEIRRILFEEEKKTKSGAPSEDGKSVEDVTGVPNERDRLYEPPTTETFLYRIATSTGRSAAEAEVAIDLLVRKHWLTTLTKLRQLDDSDWKELYLSRKVIEDIRSGLVDAVMLDMNAVWRGPIPHGRFNTPISAILHQFAEDVADIDKKELSRSLLRLIETLICHPGEPTRRGIRKGNPNFMKRAGKYECVKKLLLAVGYEDFGTHYLIPTVFLQRLRDVHSEFAAFAKHWLTPPTAGIISALPSSLNIRFGNSSKSDKKETTSLRPALESTSSSSSSSSSSGLEMLSPAALGDKLSSFWSNLRSG